MSESEFVERILSAEDQRKLSKEWYGDENYSENEVLEAPETIKRNGREFTIMEISEEQGFTIDPEKFVMADVALLKDKEEFDEVWYLGKDDGFVYFEGEDMDFIYKLPLSECPLIKLNNPLSVFDDKTYSPDREMSDYEMDTLL